MSFAPLIEYELTVDSVNPVALEFLVNSVSAAGGTALVFGLATSDPIGASMKPTAQARVIGGRLSLDKGDGVLTAVKGSELGDEIHVSGSLDGYGSRQLTFSRFGKDFSPFISSALREPRKVSFDFVRGLRGNTAKRNLFTGYFKSATFSPYPPISSISCQDPSIRWAQKPLFYTVDPGAGKTRLQIIQEIAAQEAMPTGVIDMPNDVDGGKVYKSLQVGGERTVLDFLNDFIAPTGCRMDWRGGVCNIRRQGTRIVSTGGGLGTGGIGRYTVPAAPVRTLRPCDIRSISITPPNTDAPNAIRFTALVFAYIGPSGQRTAVQIVSSYALYAPLVAVNKQDHATGVVTATGLSSSSVLREVSRIVTTTNYDGGTVISQTVDEYGWYAPKAARRKQAVTTGALSWNDLFDCWQFSDGSWRTTAQEDFQLVRRTLLTRTLDTDGYVTDETRWLYSYMPQETYIATVAAGVETPAAAYITDDGHAWIGAAESFYPETATRHYGFDSATHTLTLVYELIAAPSVGQYASTSQASSTFAFGPFNAKRYVTALSTNPSIWKTTFAYSPTTETTYRLVVTPIYLANGFTFVPGAVTRPPAASSITITGGIPVDEQKTSQQKAQPTSVFLSDKVRRVFNNGQDIEVSYQNDFCETEGELITAATELLREVADPQVQIEMDFDGMCEEGSVVALNYPGVTYGAENLLIWNWEAVLNQSTGQNSQTLGCRWDPPELAQR